MKFFSIMNQESSSLAAQDVCFASAGDRSNATNFFFVADGMGGEKAGQYASKTASSLIRGVLGNEFRKRTHKSIKRSN